MPRASKAVDPSLFPAPGPQENWCSTCGARALFALKREDESRAWFCINHVPEGFGIPETFVRMCEDLWLKNASAGSDGVAPADEKQAFR